MPLFKIGDKVKYVNPHTNPTMQAKKGWTGEVVNVPDYHSIYVRWDNNGQTGGPYKASRFEYVSVGVIQKPPKFAIGDVVIVNNNYMHKNQAGSIAQIIEKHHIHNHWNLKFLYKNQPYIYYAITGWSEEWLDKYEGEIPAPELPPQDPAKFKVGDIVTPLHPGTACYGSFGEITNVSEEAPYLYKLKWHFINNPSKYHSQSGWTDDTLKLYNGFTSKSPMKWVYKPDSKTLTEGPPSPKVIPPVPASVFSGKAPDMYIVISKQGEKIVAGIHPHVHQTLGSAIAEAKKLAGQYPMHTFYTMSADMQYKAEINVQESPVQVEA